MDALTDTEQNALEAIVTVARQIVDDQCGIVTADLDTATFDTLSEKIHDSLLKAIDRRDALIKELRAVESKLDETFNKRNEMRCLLNKFTTYIPKFPHKRVKVHLPSYLWNTWLIVAQFNS
jgi:seryl-tRNA synthetase